MHRQGASQPYARLRPLRLEPIPVCLGYIRVVARIEPMRHSLEIRLRHRFSRDYIPPVNRHTVERYRQLIRVRLDWRADLPESIQELPKVVRSLAVGRAGKQQLLNHPPRARMAPPRREVQQQSEQLTRRWADT